jgi:hypothetical protein
MSMPSRERFESAHPYWTLVRNSPSALGSPHCVVKVLDNALDEILSELEVTEVVKRCEKLEVLHEPYLNCKQPCYHYP